MPVRPVTAALLLALLGCSEKPAAQQDADDEPTTRKKRKESPGASASSSDEAPVSLFPKGSLKSLPPSTLSVRRYQARFLFNAAANFPEPVVEEAAWSRMAANGCGGTDVYAMLIDTPFMTSSGSVVGRAIKNLADTRDRLRCGKELAQSLGKSVFPIELATAALTPTEAVTSSFVVIYDASARSLSLDHEQTTSLELAGFDSAQCFPRPPAKECDQAGRISAKIAGEALWVTGPRSVVEPFGQSRAGAGPQRSADLEQLASMVASFRTAEVGLPHGFTTRFIRAIGLGNLDRWEQETFNVTFTNTLFARAVVFAEGDTMSARSGRLRIILRPENRDHLDALLAETKAWRDAALAALQAKGDPPHPTEHMTDLDKRYQLHLHHTGMRTLERAVIVRAEADVTIDFERTLDAESSKLVEEMQALATERARASQRAVRFMVDGQEPPAEIYKQIGGEKLASDVAKAKQ